MTSETSSATVDAGATGRAAGVAKIAVPALMCACVIGMVAWFISQYTTIGPIDELQHIDYAEKISRGDFVEVGDKFGRVAMREEACRGIDSPGFITPPCGSPTLSPEQFQEFGFNTAAGHPPTYYLITGIAARVIRLAPGIDSFVAAARLANGLWLAAGLLATWALLSHMRVRSRVARVSVCVVIATVPGVFYMAGTVNNDGVAIFAGAALTLAFLRFVRGSRPITEIVILSAFAAAVKFTFTPIIGVLVCWLAIEAFSTPQGPERTRLFRGAAAALISTAAVIVAWQIVSGVGAQVDPAEIPMTQRFTVDSLSLDAVVRQSLAAAPPTQNPYLPESFRIPLVGLWISLSGYFVLAGPFAAAVSGTVSTSVRRLAALTVLGMLAVGSVFTVIFFVQQKVYINIPARYGLVLLPTALACAAVALPRQGPGRLVLPFLAAVGTLSLTVALA